MPRACAVALVIGGAVLAFLTAAAREALLMLADIADVAVANRSSPGEEVPEWVRLNRDE